VPGLVAEGRSIQNATEIAQGLVRKIGFSFDRPSPRETPLAAGRMGLPRAGSYTVNDVNDPRLHRRLGWVRGPAMGPAVVRGERVGVVGPPQGIGEDVEGALGHDRVRNVNEQSPCGPTLYEA
jgi:hypothetical protein